MPTTFTVEITDEHAVVEREAEAKAVLGKLSDRREDVAEMIAEIE